MPYKRTNRSMRSKRLGRRMARRSTTVPKKVKSYVKRAIHARLENKIKSTASVNNTIFTANSVGPGDIVTPNAYNCYYQIPKGTEQADRVGTQVTPISNTIRMYFNVKPIQTQAGVALVPSYPVMVRVFLVRNKVSNSDNLATPGNTFFNNFFQQGNTTVGFQGNMLDMLLPVNKEKWHLYEQRIFRLGLPSNTGDYQSGASATDNAGFNKKVVFYCRKHFKRTLQYTDLDVSFPQNHNMWLVFTSVLANGSAPLADQTYGLVETHLTHDFVYEDG